MSRTAGLTLSMLMTGCMMGSYTGGNDIQKEYVSKIRPGITTKAEILDWFGAPQHFTDATTLGRALDATDLTPEDVVGLPFADVLVFRHTEGKLRGMILVLYNQFQWHIVNDTLVVYFDENDRVLYHGYTEGTLALQ